MWVDEFGPEDKRTLWMALCQASVPIGVMLGYLIAGYVEEKREREREGGGERERERESRERRTTVY